LIGTSPIYFAKQIKILLTLHIVTNQPQGR